MCLCCRRLFKVIGNTVHRKTMGFSCRNVASSLASSVNTESDSNENNTNQTNAIGRKNEVNIYPGATATPGCFKGIDKRFCNILRRKKREFSTTPTPKPVFSPETKKECLQLLKLKRDRLTDELKKLQGQLNLLNRREAELLAGKVVINEMEVS
ncbi:hypothetical protein XENTR_v10013626 [Xenopus tropicalis]|nr:hypothetical protein XENTR_v10013626 [Xenopus tropicalis]